MPKNCDCGGTMTAGFIPDFGHYATWVAVFMPGEAKFDKAVWDRLLTGAGADTDREKARMIEAFWCDR